MNRPRTVTEENYEFLLKVSGEMGASPKTSGLPDNTFYEIIAVLFADGFIESLDWDTPLGQLFKSLIQERINS